jgi:hypothetical protein
MKAGCRRKAESGSAMKKKGEENKREGRERNMAIINIGGLAK